MRGRTLPALSSPQRSDQSAFWFEGIVISWKAKRQSRFGRCSKRDCWVARAPRKDRLQGHSLILFVFFSLLPGCTAAAGPGDPPGLVRPTPAAGVQGAAVFSALDAETEKGLFLVLINDYRRQNGLGLLELNSRLQAASQWMSGDMAANNYFSHTDSLGRSYSQRLAAFNYPVSSTATGENIAAGYSTAAAVFEGWRNSPGHNANMLGANYRVIGIGLAYHAASDYGWYWTTDFGGQQTDPPTPTPSATFSPAEASWLASRGAVAFPNPARNRVSFVWRTGGVEARVDVYNARGERVAALRADQPGQTSLVWYPGEIAPGPYFFRVIVRDASGQTRIWVRRLAVVR